MELTTALKSVLRTTTAHLDALAELGITTVGEFLLYLPRSHEDLTSIQTIAMSQLGEKVSIRGTVEMLKFVVTRRRRKLVQGRFVDIEGGVCDVVWFNQPHVLRMLPAGSEVVLTGKLIESGMKLVMQSPRFELAGSRPLVHAGRLVAVYPQHGILSSTWIREKMWLVRDAIDLLEETLPDEVLKGAALMARRDAVRALHFPEKPADVERAQERIAFEKLYRLQKEALERKKEWQDLRQERLKIPMDVELIRAFFASLRFTPTKSQKIAIYEILKDMEKDVPMSRLLEGDVGSGKTLVAVAVMATVTASRGQCAFMVPTEVLAKQHSENIGKLLIGFQKFLVPSPDGGGLGRGGPEDFQQRFRLPTVALLTGSTPASEAESIKQSLAAGTVDIVIGTHALLENNVQFHDLRLVIVDEQHRFGVEQRRRLQEKGSPHFLSMTATPIPRTLALTAFGDHDLSVLLEKPGSRLPIRTKVVSPSERRTVELFIDKQIDEGRQAFVICPLIEESTQEEMQDIRNVEQEVTRLRTEFPRRSIAMLHGRMTPKEKEDTMQRFRARDYDILVSTSVIEVGVDVPNATIILIEGAERFGLAQLHQFRGRVGRSDAQSHCFLFPSTPGHATSLRLKAMEQYDSGFQLAEVDLRLRGPGELFGTKQSGLPEMMQRSLLNPELVLKARQAALKALGMWEADRMAV